MVNPVKDLVIRTGSTSKRIASEGGLCSGQPLTMCSAVFSRGSFCNGYTFIDSL